jgi:hypothetical protein
VLSCAAQLAADVKPAHVRQANVQHDEMRAAAVCQFQRPLACIRPPHREPFASQRVFQAAGHGAFIFDDQDLLFSHGF